MTTDRYADRREGGRELARVLAPFAAHAPVVVALPPGGVPVAFEIARALEAPLDVLEVREISAARRPTLAVGAVAEDGETVLDVVRMAAYGLLPASFEEAVRASRRDAVARGLRLRAELPPVDVRGRTVVVVADGIATVVAARAALRALRRRGARRLVLAAPVGDAASLTALATDADEVVCTRSIGELDAIDAWYEDFRPPTEAELEALLRAAAP